MLRRARFRPALLALHVGQVVVELRQLQLVLAILRLASDEPFVRARRARVERLDLRQRMPVVGKERCPGC